jgi:hypothetical protein
MNLMFVSPPNSYFEGTTPNIMVFRDRLLGS